MSFVLDPCFWHKCFTYICLIYLQKMHKMIIISFTSSMYCIYHLPKMPKILIYFY